MHCVRDVSVHEDVARFAIADGGLQKCRYEVSVDLTSILYLRTVPLARDYQHTLSTESQAPGPLQARRRYSGHSRWCAGHNGGSRQGGGQGDLCKKSHVSFACSEGRIPDGALGWVSMWAHWEQRHLKGDDCPRRSMDLRFPCDPFRAMRRILLMRWNV